ncbi:beta-glucosidase 12-like isoform X1 [Ananas comosus]|uniref:Beta-glucosidase 12-like isoform X1 n=2 Tax=Ananas comosus TaxID=4615 RepID=A0A6P5GSK2_ANACO|nr:beta-glucosidase 12-like isoform X1 [Ananas comosus]
MAHTKGAGFVFSVILVALFSNGACDTLNRTIFPHGFIFGASSSAYQYEGAVKEGGRGPSIWDTFTHTHPEKIADRTNGDVADDFYHRYKEDVARMKEMGLDAFRFSISWSRILPDGNGKVNEEGVRYYKQFINELVHNGIKPMVTLHHWDSPQALEDQYGGFLSPRIVEDYKSYTDICFKEFGDRVKHWITFNEPWAYCTNGYGGGTDAPGRCTPSGPGNCKAGDSSTEPYTVCHHLILAHAAAVRHYNEHYKAKQKGTIGITLVTPWFVPYTARGVDVDATQRVLDFMYGWFMDPLTRGDYPQSMRTYLGHRLPSFTKEHSEMVKGTYDFIGINYYNAFYALQLPDSVSINSTYLNDSRTALTVVDPNNKPIGRQGGTSFFYIYPQGLLDLLQYTKNKYNNPPIYITENGVSELNNNSKPLKEALNDDDRVLYHVEHLGALYKAIRDETDKVDVRGYFVWSFLDDFEWGGGFKVRFGLHYVDFKDKLTRHWKKSACWYTDFLGKCMKCIPGCKAIANDN